ALPASRGLCRPHPARRQARRPSSPSADQVRNHPQSKDGQGARPDGARQAARGCRRGDRVRRRDFITLLGGAAAWPVVARAQQTAKRPIVGFLGDSTPLAERGRAAAFARRLHDLGWIEGRTIAIEYRWADGRSERLGEIAAELARLKVDIIVTGGTPAVMAAKQAAQPSSS